MGLRTEGAAARVRSVLQLVQAAGVGAGLERPYYRQPHHRREPSVFSGVYEIVVGIAACVGSVPIAIIAPFTDRLMGTVLGAAGALFAFGFGAIADGIFRIRRGKQYAATVELLEDEELRQRLVEEVARRYRESGHAAVKPTNRWLKSQGVVSAPFRRDLLREGRESNLG